jgi:long-chain acyl-CoA synthetase
MNLTVPIRRTAQRYPGRPAVVDGPRRVTFGALWAAVARTAVLLRGRGLAPGDRVVVWLPDGVELLVAHLGAVAAGLVSVTVKADSGPVEVEAAIADADPRLVVSAEELLGRLPAPPRSLPVLRGDELPLDGPDLDLEPEDVLDSHPASVLHSYYFGEGRAYGAVLTHGNHRFAATHCAAFHRIDPGDRMLLVLPLVHVYTMGVGVLTSFYRGATVFISRAVRPRSLLKTLSAERITHLPAVPHLLDSLARVHDPGRYDLRAVKHLISGAVYLPETVHRRIAETLGVVLIQGYGLTECFPTVCNPPDRGNRPGTLGIGGHPEIAYRVVDAEGRERPVGEAGEIVIRSPGVMAGYLGAPEATARVLRDGWLRSGDLGWVDERGYLHFRRLLKPILNLAGNKVDPVEVARTIEELPAVATARVSAVESEEGGLPRCSLRAEVTLGSGAELAARDVRAHCRRRLTPCKVPQQVELLSTNGGGSARARPGG